MVLDKEVFYLFIYYNLFHLTNKSHRVKQARSILNKFNLDFDLSGRRKLYLNNR